MAVGRLFLLSMLGLLLVSFVHGKTLASSNTLNDVLANEKGKATFFNDDTAEDALENFVDFFAESETPESVEDVVEEEEDALEEAAEEDVKDPLELDLAGLDKNELLTFLNLEDRLLLAQIDEHGLNKKTLAKNTALPAAHGKLVRKKRSLLSSLARGAAALGRNLPQVARGATAVGRNLPQLARNFFTQTRTLVRRFTLTGITQRGRRITRHFERTGNYNNALRDFRRLRPGNVRSFDNGRIRGRTGTLGDNRVTVRNGSSGPNSRPTLEVQSQDGNQREKFRYNGN